MCFFCLSCRYDTNEKVDTIELGSYDKPLQTYVVHDLFLAYNGCLYYFDLTRLMEIYRMQYSIRFINHNEFLNALAKDSLKLPSHYFNIEMIEGVIDKEITAIYEKHDTTAFIKATCLNIPYYGLCINPALGRKSSSAVFYLRKMGFQCEKNDMSGYTIVYKTMSTCSSGCLVEPAWFRRV